MEQAQQSLERPQTVGFGETKQLCPELSFRFVPSAHILGAGMVEITAKANGGTRQLLFTGDIGCVRDSIVAPGRVVHSGPQGGENADLLVMASRRPRLRPGM